MLAVILLSGQGNRVGAERICPGGGGKNGRAGGQRARCLMCRVAGSARQSQAGGALWRDAEVVVDRGFDCLVDREARMVEISTCCFSGLAG